MFIRISTHIRKNHQLRNSSNLTLISIKEVWTHQKLQTQRKLIAITLWQAIEIQLSVRILNSNCVLKSLKMSWTSSSPTPPQLKTLQQVEFSNTPQIVIYPQWPKATFLWQITLAICPLNSMIRLVPLHKTCRDALKLWMKEVGNKDRDLWIFLLNYKSSRMSFLLQNHALLWGILLWVANNNLLFRNPIRKELLTCLHNHKWRRSRPNIIRVLLQRQSV